MNRKNHHATRLVTAAAALTLVSAGAAATTSLAQAAPTAARAPHAQTLVKGLVSPLSFAIAENGTRYFSMNFTGGLFRQVPGAKPTPLYQTKGGAEAGAVSERNGTVTFGVTAGGGPQGTTDSYLMRIKPGGQAKKFAAVGAYEKKKNPDKAVTYGFVGLDAACAGSLPKALGPATYTGTKDSHPYATLMTGSTTYLADAAANAILAISASGKVSTVAVLPPVPVVITAEAAAANKIPDCAVGKTYNFEPVPTDVEMGPGGKLYVASLPGGPEDGSTGPQGGVFTVNPKTGKVARLASGLLGAVGIAVAKNGDVYASQLFGGQISRLKAGSSTFKPYVKVALPGDVEMVDGSLYASTNVLPGGPKDPPAGKLVQILP